jgi:hypothetical protein
LQKVESGLSTWSKPNLIKPLFASDSASILNNEPAVQRRVYRRDDPWQAAQRGDLVALKGFQLRGQVDWTSKDENGNIPLQYACSTGALENVMVVPFLLWATDLGDDESAMIETCRKNCCNKQAKAILKAYKKGGRAAIGMGSREQAEIQETHKQQVGRASDNTSGMISEPSKSRGDENCDKLPMSTGSIDFHSETSISTLSGQSEDEKISASDEDQSISGKLGGEGCEEIGLEVDNASSPSSSSHGIVNSWVVSDKSSFVQPTANIQQPGLSERLHQAVVESGEQPLKRPVPAAGSTKKLVIHRTPPSIAHNLKGNRMSPTIFRDQRDVRDDMNSNEIEDWDKPIEQHRNGRQSFLLGVPAPPVGSDNDSWSFGSMLSLKKLQRRRGRWDDWKVAMLLGQERETGTPRNRPKTIT